jgi:hypothetical protein
MGRPACAGDFPSSRWYEDVDIYQDRKLAEPCVRD